jgi:hypothetical protein
VRFQWQGRVVTAGRIVRRRAVSFCRACLTLAGSSIAYPFGQLAGFSVFSDPEGFMARNRRSQRI